MVDLRFYDAAGLGADMPPPENSLEFEAAINITANYLEIRYQAEDPLDLVQSSSLYVYDYDSYFVITDIYSRNAAGENVRSLTNAYARFDAGNIADLNRGLEVLLLGSDRIDGNKYNDALRGYGGADEIQGKAGNDRIYGDGGADTLFGGGGKDVLVGGRGNDDLIGNAGSDKLRGGGADDRLYGQGGRDVLFGNGGRDFLSGNKGSDRLVGGRGYDELGGGKGDDIMSGGAGSDRFVFYTRNEGIDVITDFNRRKDEIYITEKAEGAVSVGNINESTVIYYGSGGEIILEDVVLSAGQIDLYYF